MRKFISLLLIPFCLLGCKNNDQSKTDQQTIQNYITAHHLNAIAEPNGLYYVPTATGNGGYPNAYSTVTVSYKGYLTNDTVFDQNTFFTTNLGNTIPGWIEGIPLIQKGGSGTLLIPSALGYGTQAQGSIPANSVLIFDVHLISFQ